MKNGIVYKATNLVNKKVYIGITINGLCNRMGNHKKDAENGSIKAFHSAIRKYGWENFKWDVIDNKDNFDSLREREKYWIEYYRSFTGFTDCNGYNMTLGGDGSLGYKHEKSFKKMISEVHKGKVQSDETKRRISENKRGANNYQSKITEEVAKQIIYDLTNTSLTLQEISDKHNATYGVVQTINRGKSWGYLCKDGVYPCFTNKRGNKVTEKDITTIREMIANNVHKSEIAKKYNVGLSSLYRALQRYE